MWAQRLTAPCRVLLVLILGDAPAFAAEAVLVQNIRVVSGSNNTRIVFDLEKAVPFQDAQVENRLVLSLSGARLSPAARQAAPSYLILEEDQDPRAVRAKVSLEGVRFYKVLSLTHPDRLVALLVRASPAPLSEEAVISASGVEGPADELVSVREAPRWGKDPFRLSLGQGQARGALGALRLQAIIYREGRDGVAIINNRIVRQGEEIGGNIVSGIHRDRVILRGAGDEAGETIELGLDRFQPRKAQIDPERGPR